MPYLIDKSALARMSHPRVQARLVPVLEGGEAATCAVIDLEVLYSTRNAADHARARRRRALAYRNVELNEAIFQRAIEVQGLLALRGQHHVPIPALIVLSAMPLDVSRPLACVISVQRASPECGRARQLG